MKLVGKKRYENVIITMFNTLILEKEVPQFAEFINQGRHMLKITIAEVGNILGGVSMAQIYKYERGESEMTVANFMKLVKFYNKRHEELFYKAENDPNAELPPTKE